MGRADRLLDWIDEAEERLDDQRHKVDHLSQHVGESTGHFRHRKERERERQRRRREVLDLLRKKSDHLAKEKERAEPPAMDGFATFDGKTVAAWMVRWLEESRRAGWDGVVVSGVRTPEYSEQLCYNMCGASSCPGKCAGRASNHNMSAGQGYPYGALDVSDYYNFERIQFNIGSPLRNDLPVDPVHFSVSGR